MERPVIVFGMNTMFAVRQFLPEVLEMARTRGFRTIVLAPPEDGVALPEIDGIDYRPISMQREIAPFADLCSLLFMIGILRQVRPAICNMSTPKMGLLGGIAAWITRVPHRIYTLRGLRYETTRSWKRRLLMSCEKVACACAHQVICTSRSLREAAIRDRIVSARKAILLGNRVSEGLSLEPQATQIQQPTRKGLGIPETSSVIGFVGRLTKDKGVPELVAAFRTLRERPTDLRLLLIGAFETGDPVDVQTERFIRTDAAIHWTGSVPDARPYYELMDIFVFPTYREGLGRVLLEAAAAGKPVVSTRTTGVVDVVIDGVTGLLVPPGNSEALVTAVERLLGDPVTAQRMGANARTLIEREFDNSIYLQRLAAVLETMAGLRPAKENAAGGRSLSTEAACTPCSSSQSSRCS